MTDQPKKIVPTWVLLGAAGFALVAILDIPYGYYRLLRWVTCAVAIAAAIQLHRSCHLGWVWALGSLAVLFNPIIPIHFERKTWIVFDGLAGGLFLAVFFLTRKIKEEADKMATPNLIAERAAKGSQQDFLKAMSMVPAGEVAEGDEIPAGYKRAPV